MDKIIKKVCLSVLNMPKLVIIKTIKAINIYFLHDLIEVSILPILIN
jgi:hypothetical protein